MYYLLTVRRAANCYYETFPYMGSIGSYILIEKELGRDVAIVWSLEITEDEYNLLTTQF
ncbi:MAG TPA: hypothetical protein PK431_16880 [Chitinophagales bacterium]|nr:hypothetical protein [Chitinophagales bacterium]